MNQYSLHTLRDAVIGYPDIEIIDDKSIQKEMRQAVFHTRQSVANGGTRKPS